MNDALLKRAIELKEDMNEILRTVTLIDQNLNKNFTMQSKYCTINVPSELKEKILKQLSDYYYAELDRLRVEFKNLK